MARFFVTKDAVKEDRIEITDPDDLHHITRVLRLAEGDFIDVSDSEEYEYRVELTLVAKDMAVGKIHDKQSFSKEPGLDVSLYQAVPKQSKMDTIIQKTVELGIKRIIPVFTKRCVVTDGAGRAKKLDRWRKISAEAVKQCKRGIVPEVEEPLSFGEMMETVFQEHDLVLFLYENEQAATIKQALRDFASEWVLVAAAPICGEEPGGGFTLDEILREKEKPAAGKKPALALIVGPEGGFSEEEAQALKNSPAKCVTLGRTILRTETAGMAALAMVMYELEL